MNIQRERKPMSIRLQDVWLEANMIVFKSNLTRVNVNQPAVKKENNDTCWNMNRVIFISNFTVGDNE